MPAIFAAPARVRQNQGRRHQCCGAIGRSNQEVVDRYAATMSSDESDPRSSETSEQLIARLRNAPRLTAMATTFENLASGASGRPTTKVAFEMERLGGDYLARTVAVTLDHCAGTFDEHYVASIPYAREQEARVGAAYLSYLTSVSEREQRRAGLYVTSGADGPVPRAVASLGRGRIETLTCSPNKSNLREFNRNGTARNASFFLGPYFDVTPEELVRRGMPQFGGGFDVIEEDTTFQMYDPDRIGQIALVRRNLRPDGVLVLTEKLQHLSPAEYRRREQQKDTEFKALHFSETQIEDKKHTVLNNMDDMQVTLKELSWALKRHFKAAVILFNSGNFYSIAASDNPENLGCFIGHFLDPAVPGEFSNHELPQVLFGMSESDCAFRRPDAFKSWRPDRSPQVETHPLSMLW